MSGMIIDQDELRAIHAVLIETKDHLTADKVDLLDEIDCCIEAIELAFAEEEIDI